MFEKFEVRPSLDETVNSHWHFTAHKDGIDYTGHYDGGEIHWFQPKPEDHHIEQMEQRVHTLMEEYTPLDSEMR
ncbi:DUF5342 family protein [Cohnella mopanensis]|uniref:DUF5342 family protein n=1 Tax=Cohnella mopanensis TaxID=2911966 RepID=UPI001EF8AE12|nr:DUF5342 family protein [Cohnella mopanensis]